MATLPIRAWIIIEDGNTEVDYVNRFPLYTGRYQILDAPVTNITGQTPTETLHDSDDGPPDTINLEEQRRVWAFALKVTGDNPAQVSKNISNLRRHIQGKHSTAYQAYLNKSQPRVIFRMQLDSTGSSPLTDFVIQHGSIQDNSSYYRKDALINEIALDVNVNLICTPAGRGETITLRNDLASSPHFIEDSNGGGLADGWGASNWVTTLDTDIYLIGGKSQKLVTVDAVSTSNMNNTPAVAVAASSNIVAYIWITAPGAVDPIRLRIQDGGGLTIQQKIFTTDGSGTETSGISDMMVIGASGDKWYRVSFSGTNTNANVLLVVNRNAAEATQISTYYVDGAYLEVGQTVIPDAFSSTAALQNRYDPTAANQERINYLDVWGVPGDMPAYVKTDLSIIDTTFTGTLLNYVGQQHDGRILAANHVYRVEGENIATIAAWSNVVDATVSNGSYKRNANTGTAMTNTLDFSVAQSQSLFLTPKRVFLRCRANLAGCTIAVTVISASGDTILTLNTVNVVNSTSWYLLDLGILNGVGLIDPTNPDVFDIFNVDFSIVATAPAAANIDFDVFYFMPVDEFMIYRPLTDNDSITAHYGGVENVYNDNSDTLNRPVSGSLYRTNPAMMSRYMFVVTDKTGLSRLTDILPEVSLTITPIASHLIGE